MHTITIDILTGYMAQVCHWELIEMCLCECVFLTDTQATNILPVAHVAFAAVAWGCGNAASIQTQVGEMFAYINAVVHRNSTWEYTYKEITKTEQRNKNTTQKPNLSKLNS